LAAPAFYFGIGQRETKSWGTTNYTGLESGRGYMVKPSANRLASKMEAGDGLK
jgi:hypothetical protein